MASKGNNTITDWDAVRQAVLGIADKVDAEYLVPEVDQGGLATGRMRDSREEMEGQPDPEVMRQYMATLEQKYPGKFKMPAGYNVLGMEQPGQSGPFEDVSTVNRMVTASLASGEAVENTIKRVLNMFAKSGTPDKFLNQPDQKANPQFQESTLFQTANDLLRPSGNVAENVGAGVIGLAPYLAPVAGQGLFVADVATQPESIPGQIKGMGQSMLDLYFAGQPPSPRQQEALENLRQRPVETLVNAGLPVMVAAGIGGRIKAGKTPRVALREFLEPEVTETPIKPTGQLLLPAPEGYTAGQYPGVFVKDPSGRVIEVPATKVKGEAGHYVFNPGTVQDWLTLKQRAKSGELMTQMEKGKLVAYELRFDKDWRKIWAPEVNKLALSMGVKEKVISKKALKERIVEKQEPVPVSESAVYVKTSKRGKPLFVMKTLPNGTTPEQAMAHYRDALRTAKEGGGRLYFGPGFEQTELFADLNGRGLVSAKATKDGGFYALDPEAKVRQSLANRVKAKEKDVSRETLKQEVANAEGIRKDEGLVQEERPIGEGVENQGGANLELETSEKPGNAETQVAPTAPPVSEPGKVMKAIDKLEADARARLETRAKKMGTTLSANPIPEFAGAMGDIAVIGAAKIARGTVEFAKWSAEMVAEFGEKIRPELQRLYAHAMLISKAAAKEDVKANLSTRAKVTQAVGGAVTKTWETAKFVKQAKNKLKTEPGKEGYALINEADAVEHSKYIGPYDEEARQAGMKYMGGKEAKRVGAELQKKTTTDSKALRFRALLDKIHSDMTTAGLDVGYLKGYLPRVFKEGVREKLYNDARSVLLTLPEKTKSDKYVVEALAKKSNELKETVKAMMDDGMSFRNALKVIAKATEKDLFIKSSAEYSRTLKFPSQLYETDIRKIIPRYIRSVSKRMAEAEVFGVKGEKWNDLQQRVMDVDFKEAELTQRLLDTWSGKYELEHGLRGGARKAEEAYYMAQTTTKIGFGTATVPNITQPLISTVPDVGIWRSIKAGVDFLNPQSRSGVRKTGTTEHTALSLFGAPEHGIASRLTKPVMFLFQGVNRFNQYFSALAAKQAIPDWYKSAQKDTNYGRLCRERLADMGIDSAKPLDQATIKKGMYHYSTDAQLQKNIMNEPLSANNPRTRWLWLFKKFGYKQAARTAERLKMELRHGNVMYPLKLIAGGVIGGEAVIWAKNKIKEAATGQPVYREEDWKDWERYINDLAAVGTVGVVTDIFDFKKIYDLPQDVWFSVKPVILDDVEKSLGTAQKVLREIDKYGWGVAAQRNWDIPLERAGSIPRWLSQRTDVPAVQQERLKQLKGEKRTAILDLIIEGKAEKAALMVRLWNEHYPDALFEPNDVGEHEVLKRMKEKARNVAGAIEPVKKGTKTTAEPSGETDSPQTKALRKRIQEMQSEARP